MVYKPGVNNPADYISRHPDLKQSQASHHVSRVDAYVNFVTSNAVPPAVTLQVSNGVILRGIRIIVPEKLRGRMIMLAHSGHQGIVKTKRFLRDSVWFPGIDRMVEEVVKGCVPCQAANHDPKPVCEPLHMSLLPLGPW